MGRGRLLYLYVYFFHQVLKHPCYLGVRRNSAHDMRVYSRESYIHHHAADDPEPGRRLKIVKENESNHETRGACG